MKFYRPVQEQLDDRTIRLGVEDASGRTLTRGDVLQLWDIDDWFCEEFSDCLAAMPFNAFAWETPPLTLPMLTEPFECVVVDSPMLARQPADGRPFASQFDAADGDVIAFQSLGGDAELIAPRDLGQGADYSHFAAFLRSAPRDQRLQLWWSTSRAVVPWVSTGKPLWLSTAGLGGAWLHVRLDSRPKYYRHGPYRNAKPA